MRTSVLALCLLWVCSCTTSTSTPGTSSESANADSAAANTASSAEAQPQATAADVPVIDVDWAQVIVVGDTSFSVSSLTVSVRRAAAPGALGVPTEAPDSTYDPFSLPRYRLQYTAAPAKHDRLLRNKHPFLLVDEDGYNRVVETIAGERVSISDADPERPSEGAAPEGVDGTACALGFTHVSSDQQIVLVRSRCSESVHHTWIDRRDGSSTHLAEEELLVAPGPMPWVIGWSDNPMSDRYSTNLYAADQLDRPMLRLRRSSRDNLILWAGWISPTQFVVAYDATNQAYPPQALLNERPYILLTIGQIP